MRIMITGASGFIGSRLLTKLGDDPTVSVMGIDITGMKQYEQYITQGGSNYKAICNILDRSHLAMLFEQWQPHIVFHLAAKLGVDDVIANPGQTISENVVGTMNVAELCKSHNAHMIFASTSDVYGHSTDLPFKEDGHLLLGPSVEPRWSYGISKLAGEHFTLANGGTVLRFFNVTGPGQSTKYVVPKFVNWAVNNETIKIYGDGTQTRCFTHVADVVDCLNMLMDCSVSDIGGNIYNIGSDREISMLELAEKVRELVRPVDLEFVDAGSLYTEMPRRVPDTKKIRELLDWEPQIGLRETILETGILMMPDGRYVIYNLVIMMMEYS